MFPFPQLGGSTPKPPFCSITFFGALRIYCFASLSVKCDSFFSGCVSIRTQKIPPQGSLFNATGGSAWLIFLHRLFIYSFPTLMLFSSIQFVCLPEFRLIPQVIPRSPLVLVGSPTSRNLSPFGLSKIPSQVPPLPIDHSFFFLLPTALEFSVLKVSRMTSLGSVRVSIPFLAMELLFVTPPTGTSTIREHPWSHSSMTDVPSALFFPHVRLYLN